MRSEEGREHNILAKNTFPQSMGTQNTTAKNKASRYHTSTIPARPLSIDSIEENIWHSLTRATTDRFAPYRTATFATINTQKDNSIQLTYPSIRTVVLRTVDKQYRELSFNSDARSTKLAQINDCPQVSWLFYSQAERTQLRLNGIARVIQGDRKKTAWEQAQIMSKRCYCGQHPPGTISPNGPKTGLTTLHSEGLDHDFEKGYKNFARIITTVTHIDWLYLSRKGNLRAQFTYTTDSMTATWLYP